MGSRQNQQGFSSGSPSGHGSGTGGGGGRDSEETPRGNNSGSIDTQMALALLRLQQDMNSVMERVANLEKAQKEQVCILDSTIIIEASIIQKFFNVS